MKNDKTTRPLGIWRAGRRRWQHRWTGALSAARARAALAISLVIASAAVAGCNGSNERLVIVVPTATATVLVTSTMTPGATPTPTLSPTPVVPTATATVVVTSTMTPGATPTPTHTPTPTVTPTAAPTPLSATGSSVFGMDCQAQQVWVALNNTGGVNGDGKVAVVDLTVDPDKSDPVKALIDLGNNDIPSGVAATGKQVLVTAGATGHGGHLYIFKQSDNSRVPGSPFAFPAGSDTNGDGCVIFDPVRNQAIVSLCNTLGCSGLPDSNTGWAFFDLATNKFGPVIEAAQPDSVSFNPVDELVIAPADAIDPPSPFNEIGAGDSTRFCTLTDKNLTDTAGDPDGSSADRFTNIFALGNFSVPSVTVVNLNGATFSGPTARCTLDEAGVDPNSVDVGVFVNSGDNADIVAINEVTHQAFVGSDLGPDVALIELPNAPVTQLTGPLPFQASALPVEPDGSSFAGLVRPFTATVDTCKNQGLMVDNSFDFVAKVDLKTLHDSAVKISTPLAPGTCFGGFSVSCSNGNGVTYYPLHALSVDGAASTDARRRDKRQLR